jgi:hypothetical protein
MPISGPVVHQQLMDAYTSTQTRLESERGQILHAKQQRDQLDDDRSEALVSLAEHYLPELTREAISETWFELRPAVSQILLRKQEHSQRADDALNLLTSQRQQQDLQLVASNHEFDQAIEAQNSVAEKVRSRLQEDPRFVQLSDRAAVAEAALERAEANLEEIDQDSVRKLPSYDGSSLFRYLHDRGFGTQQYAKRGFTRRMDRWLAKFIDYHKAKQGYEFLRRTPEQMRQIIAEDRRALDTVMDELERSRDEVAAAFGLPEKIEQSKQFQQQRAEQLKSLDAILQETEKTQNELAELEDSRGPYYREAIELFREMFAKSDSHDLKRRAQQTGEISDDQIVARLMGVESEIGHIEEAARRRRQELDQMRSFLQDLGRLVQRFRAAQFDSSRSQFVGSLDVFEELERARDANDIQVLWQRIRSLQRWGPAAEHDADQASEPLTGVLIDAMGDAAGTTMQTHARRAGTRRAQRDSSWGGGG